MLPGPLPSRQSQLARLSAIRLDMLDNGIDLDRPDLRHLCGLVRRNLDYFQLMLGYDAGLREVVTLVQDARGPGGGRRGRRPPN